MKVFKIVSGIIAALAGIVGLLFASNKKSEQVKKLKKRL